MERGINSLRAMLAERRPMGNEYLWCKRWLAPLGAEMDDIGNWILKIGDSPYLWSSHTDTVHWHGGRQPVYMTRDKVLWTSAEKSNCLGADCTTGAWLMREMALHGVPGLYVWHYGEEQGCLGSKAIALHNPDLLHGIDYAIAFDRRGTTSVITHQCGWRTASDEFAIAFGDLLGLGMEPDDGGTWTDTNEYAHLVPECTNISVGYQNAHGRGEWQDAAFAWKLRNAMLAVDWSSERLPVNREPAIEEPVIYRHWSRTVTANDDVPTDELIRCESCDDWCAPEDIERWHGWDLCTICLDSITDYESTPTRRA